MQIISIVLTWIKGIYKKVMSISKYLLIPLIIIFPFFLEKLVAFNDIKTTYGGNEWFAFWGSYSGAIITCVVLYITIKHNNKLIKAGLRESDIRRECKEKIEIADYSYRIISLMDYYPCEYDDIKHNFYNFIKYDFKLLNFKISRHDNCGYYALVNELEEIYLQKVDSLKDRKLDIPLLEVKEILESMYEEFELKRNEIEEELDKHKNTLLQEMNDKILQNYN